MRKTVAYAFHHSIPILIGFFPVGLAYGLLMQQAGYNFLWSGACSLFVLAGSLQFLMVTFFAGGVSLLAEEDEREQHRHDELEAELEVAGGAVLQAALLALELHDAVETPATLFGLSVHGWNDCWLDLYDMVAEGILMPLRTRAPRRWPCAWRAWA